MSDIQLYLFEADKNKDEALRIASQSARRLETKELKLLDLIQSTSEYINDDKDDALRAKSVAYLADILAAVPAKVLSGHERRLLCDFMLGRIEGDSVGIGSYAKALLALEGLGKWDQATAQKVMRTFLDYTHPLKQFKLQGERYAVLQLIDLLLAKYRTAMQQLHVDDTNFMSTFISYFDGEKDPRNLMIAFSNFQVPATEWDLDASAQDLFESVFNYFPITFKPPPDDPYGITAQQLKDRLRDCLAASSEFAPYAFPALLDKLDSTSMNTKRDVLQALMACVSGYEAKTVNLYSVTLWDALKFEILNVQEDDLAADALEALSLIAKQLERIPGPLNAYLRPIVKECNEHLEDAPTKQSQAAGKILNAVAKASPTVADALTKGILPNLFTLFQASDSISKRRGLIEVLNDLVKSYIELAASGNRANPSTLQAFNNDMLEALLRALLNAPKSEVSFRLLALQGLTQLVKIRKLLVDAEITRVVDAVTNVILHEDQDLRSELRSAAIQSLTDIAHYNPDLIRDRAVPAFMAQLPDVPDAIKDSTAILEAFAQLSAESQIFDTIVLRLRNKLNAASHQGAPTEYRMALLAAILFAFTKGSPVREADAFRETYFRDYAAPFLEQVKVTVDSEIHSPQQQIRLEIIGRICNLTLRSQSPHYQGAVYGENLQWLSPVLENGGASDTLEALAPFLLYYYASFLREVPHPDDVTALLKSIAQSLLGSTKACSTVKPALRLVSLIVNKFIEPKAVQATLSGGSIDMDGLLKEKSSNAISLAFAVSKGLVIQGKSNALVSKHIESMLALLSSVDVGKSIARSFSGLLEPDDILTKENHCFVSGLHKQRIFNQTVPALVQSVRVAETSTKPNYLVALSGILRWLPYSIIEPSLYTLVPPLLQSLDLSEAADQDVKASALTILESVLMHDPSMTSEHVASLITRLLNSTAAPTNSPKVRSTSLQCLTLVPRQLKREAVVPFRKQVVKRLMACLDDAKRSVRSEAVRCRSAWLALDEEDEEE